MSTLYMISLAVVGLVLLGVMLEAIVSVSRKAQWQIAPSSLQLVRSVDRRQTQLSYVGLDRRQSAEGETPVPAEPLRHQA